jgi:FkbM family methyltransferase
VKSYSQFGEDAAIADLFDGMFHFSQPGRLLEIGAWDPQCFSNSRLLIEAGWDGVLIEPSPQPLRALTEFYHNAAGPAMPRVDVIQAAVVLQKIPLVNIRFSDDAVSSYSAEHLHKWKNAANFIGDCWCATITLQDIWNQFGGFDFVSIDTEGSSVDLAKQYLEAEARPKVMMVEYDERLPELLTFATQFGYKAVLTNGTNVVLAK